MKQLFLLLLLAISFSSAIAQPYVFADKNGQMYNVANGYYGTINANTIDAAAALDTFNGTTVTLYAANWYRAASTGITPFDSARILKLNKSGIGPYYQPYSWGFEGKGTLSITANVLKASSTSTVTPTVLITPMQSPNGINGWVQIPGTTVATVSPSSRTVAVSITFNILDTYEKYAGLKFASTDTSSGQAFYNFKPKTY